MKWAHLTMIGFLTLGSCHARLYYPAESPSTQQHHLEQDFWLWGQVGEWQVEASAYCAEGRIYEAHFYTTLRQGLFSLFSLGIYSPRTLVLTCSGEVAPLPTPAVSPEPLPEFLPPDPNARPFEQH